MSDYLRGQYRTNDDYYTVKKRSSYQTKNYGIYFTIPDHVFLNSYKDINKYNINKLLESTDKEDICFKIISKHIADYSEIKKGVCIEIIESINCLEETESFSILYNSIVQKNIDLLISNKDIEYGSDNFESFLEIINHYNWKKSKLSTIEMVNSQLSEEQIFKYWKATKYFSPPIDFIYKHFDKLSHNDFINAPLEFHDEYFLTEFSKLKFDNSLYSFCNLLFLILEIPGSQLMRIEQKLSPEFTSALWLYNTIHENDYNQDYSKVNFNVNFSKENFIDYLNLVENLNQIILNTKVIDEICIAFRNHKPNSSNLNTFYRFSNEDRINTIEKVLHISKDNSDISSTDILKVVLIGCNNQEKLKTIFSFIPKFIDPNEDLNFQALLTFENYFHNDSINRFNYFNFLSKLISLQKKITLWYDDYINEIDINVALKFLNECSDDIQFKALKKIFSLIHLNKDLVTHELFGQFEDLANNKSLNLNVRIALFVLITLKRDNIFVNDKTIFELICQRLKENINELVKIDELLDKCTGRTWKTHSYDGGGKDKWFVIIRGHEFAVDNNFINIEGKNYYLNKESKSININGIYYNFSWAKRTNVFYTKNYEIPDGLTFCDASKSQIDPDLNINFYWCCNSKCYSPCQKDYNPFQWKKYTLRDFIKILKIPFDNDLYYRFVAVINRVNRLLIKLKCNSCNKLMRDAITSEFAFYRVNTFHCTDPNCSEYHKTVYLTHCLNWRCLNIIDTRISKACPNGWYICEKCDNCCSQEKIDRRYQNLLTNAAFNPNNSRHQKLKFQVDNKLGHLERNEVYDFKTGEKK